MAVLVALICSNKRFDSVAGNRQYSTCAIEGVTSCCAAAVVPLARFRAGFTACHGNGEHLFVAEVFCV